MIKKFYKGDYNRNHCEVWTVDDIDFEDYFGDVGTDYADKFVDLLNQMNDENNQLKQFPVKLENRIQKLQEDLQKLIEMDKSDLNPQAIEDVATVINISLNALMEFQKELME